MDKKITRRQQLVNDLVNRAQKMGIAKQTTQDHTLNGRTITLNGRPLINFAQCSYLGLEQDERLKRGAIEAVERYGSQFSSSRAYLSVTLYEEYEELLSKLFGYPTIVSPSTTLGHLSNLPLLIGGTDVFILDQFVHTSITMTASLLKGRGIQVEKIRHNDLHQLETRVKKYASLGQRVWYAVDGIYSMEGNFAPLMKLRQLQEKFPQLHLYIDDAHGMSWRGRNGVGFALSQIPLNDRTILITSLNKAFASGGGAMVFPNEELRDLVRNAGQTLMFSGPLQPASLGAGIASARLHLSPEIDCKQQELQERINYFNKLAHSLRLPLANNDPSPIRYIGIGSPTTGYDIVHRLNKMGYFTNIAAFPSVPLNRTGMRITLSTHHSFDDISDFLHTTVRVVEEVFHTNGIERGEVAKLFG